VCAALHDSGIHIVTGHCVVDVIFNSRHFLHGVRLENKVYSARTKEAGSTERGGKGCGSDGRGVRTLQNSDVTPQYSTIDCSALLCCVRRSCDADAFNAINESGLVYDGGAVVDQVSSSRRNPY
jgi:hypothetical protein